MIYIGKNTGLKEFGLVLKNWGKIHKAIYEYDPRDCVRDNLNIDSIRTFDKPYSKQFSDSKGKVFTLGTIYPCYKDDSSSDPVWEISEKDGFYTVVGYSSIEE